MGYDKKTSEQSNLVSSVGRMIIEKHYNGKKFDEVKEELSRFLNIMKMIQEQTEEVTNPRVVGTPEQIVQYVFCAIR